MKTPDYFYKLTASQLNIDLELSRKANKFFWRKGIVDNIRSGEEPIMFVKYLGTFYIRHWDLREAISKKIINIRTVRADQSKDQEGRDKTESVYMSELLALLKARNKMAIALNKIKQLKIELVNEEPE